MRSTELGSTGESLSAIGFGAMPLSIQNRPPEAHARAVLQRAIDLGVTFIDTADSYCLDESDKHHNERLIARVLAEHPNGANVRVATKGGIVRPNGAWEVYGEPGHLRTTIRESYQALGGQEPIFLWQLHAPDDRYPIEDSLKPVREAVDEGLIRYVGLSNVTVEEIERARQIVDVVSIQNKYNPWHRHPESDGVLDYCERHHLTFIPWSPLGGSRRVKHLPEIKDLNAVAVELGVSPMRLVLAWMLAKSPCILPIPGAARLESLEDSLQAVDLKLTPEHIARIDAATRPGSLVE